MARPRARPGPTDTTGRPGTTPEPGWEGRAFGLGIRSEVALAGFPEQPAGSERTLTLRLAGPEEIAARWSEADAQRLVDQHLEDQAITATIDHLPGSGYLFRSGGFGAFLLSPDGSEVWGAPVEPGQTWHWQSFITGQVLPAAALLQGLEILHASAVMIRGHAVAFHGFSGAGKTSVALNLVLRGGQLMADDVLALEAADRAVIAHPGPPVVNLLDEERERLGGSNLSGLGPTLGQEGGISRVAVTRTADEPASLRCLYRLERQPGGSGQEAAILPDPAPTFQTLVDLTFNTVFRSPSRRLAQLEVFSALTESSHIYTIRIPPNVDATQLAAQVERHVSQTLG